MRKSSFIITQTHINQYIAYLKETERADNTIEKYSRDIRAFMAFLNGEAVTKEAAVEWKLKLRETHAVTSINGVIAAINGFSAFFKLGIKVKPYRIQKQLFISDRKDLSKDEYERLLRAANSKHNERLFYIIQAICATGIRVSELKYITVEAVRDGHATVTNKGKTRTIFIPNDLRSALLEYAKRRQIQAGCIFVTRSGKPLNRSNI